MRLSLSPFLLSAMLTIFAVPAFSQDEPLSERELSTRIGKDFRARKTDEGLSGLAEFRNRFPESRYLKGLLYQAGYAHASRRQYEKATPFFSDAVDLALAETKKNPSTATTLVSYTSMLTSMLSRTDKEEQAVEKLDAILKELGESNDGKNTQLSSASSQLVYSKAMMIYDTKPDDAIDLVSSETVRARKAFESNEDRNLSWYLATRYNQLIVAMYASPESFEKLRDAHLEFVDAQAARKQDAAVINSYYQAYRLAVSSLTYADVDRAEKLLNSSVEFLNGIDTESAAVKASVNSGKRSLASYTRRIASARRQLSLLGKDAFPLESAAWVNGSPLTDADLKGKVVLLDFWAVWCGPCIATFPHLIEWHEQYSEKGLVIIGATRYEKFGWDDAAKRSFRKAGISKEDEQEATRKFAEHHNLKHRLMFLPEENKFRSSYLISGIPHAVLIGRDGKIRMVRVGSGALNAKALHDEIEKLLAE